MPVLTQRARYGLKALVYLTRQQDDGWQQAQDIAEAEGIPRSFLDAILPSLRRGGLIASKTGRYGGHKLARKPSEIDLLSVLRLLDGPVAPLPCLSRTAYQRCDDCQNEATCGSRQLLARVHHATLQALERTTLADLDREEPDDWPI